MKALSIWNPYSQLIVTGHKRVETRTWLAPHWLIGKRIAIAATKIIKPEQLVAFNDPSFRRFYDPTGLPAELVQFPRGAIIGSVILVTCDLMTPELIDATPAQEKAFGIWKPGNYAWRLIEPRVIEPRPVRGGQGVWNYEGEV